MPVRAEASTIHQAARDVEAAKQQADAKLTEVRNSAADAAPGFAGQAGSSFQTLMQRYNEEATKLTVAMQDIADVLNSQGTAITTTDEEQMADMNKYTGTLNG
jgi:WXG100 family type VII secretion target